MSATAGSPPPDAPRPPRRAAEKVLLGGGNDTDDTTEAVTIDDRAVWRDGTEVGRFRWERTLRSPDGPKGTQLLVLLTLATYMNGDGTGAYASQRTLAAATGTKDRTVRKHLAAAVDDGWLRRDVRGHRKGDGTAFASVYRAALPARVCQLSDPPKVAKNTTKKPASTGTRMPQEPNVNRHETTPQPAPNEPQPAPGCHPPSVSYKELNSVCVEDLAISKLNTPAQKQHDEAKVKIAALVAIHGEEAVRAELEAMPDACIPFGGEVYRILKARLDAIERPPKCERCQDTGQTSTGYVCGCAATAGRRAS